MKEHGFFEDDPESSYVGALFIAGFILFWPFVYVVDIIYHAVFG